MASHPLGHGSEIRVRLAGPMHFTSPQSVTGISADSVATSVAQDVSTTCLVRPLPIPLKVLPLRLIIVE